MGYILTIEEVMETDAEFGFFYTYHKITKKKANELRNLGFIVTELNSTLSYPRLHKISWDHIKVEYDDVKNLNHNDKSYTLPQKLWIISKKNEYCMD